MTEVVQPLLPPRYNDETGYLDYVETDPAIGIYTPPQGSAARLRWLTGFYQDDGSPQRLRVHLNLNIDGNISSLVVAAIPQNVVSGFCTILFATEIGTPALVPIDAGASVSHESQNPLPSVTIVNGGFISVGFVNGTRLQPDQLSLEIFPQEGAGSSGGGPPVDLYLLPGTG